MNRLLLTLLASLALGIAARAGVWDVATPLNIDPISQGDDRIREMKSALQEALRGGATDGEEAIFPGASPTTAPIFRYRGLKGSTAGRPTAASGGLYFNTTTGTIQRSSYTATDTGAGWEDLTENAAFEAIHQKVPQSLASVTGVVTLPETANAFVVSGSEAMTSITGWSAGVVVIQWSAARTLTHSSGFYLKNALSRAVVAGDISTFIFTGANTAVEVGFYGDSDRPTMTKQYLLSGTAATYTTGIVNGMRAKKIIVKMRAGGGGGADSEAGTGADGTDTSFNSIVASKGLKGTSTIGLPGAGGTGGSGSASLRIAGSSGARWSGTVGANLNGIAAPANSGLGGEGGSYWTGSRIGGSGGNGEYVEIVIDTPAATYTYTVGAGGAGSAAGTYTGGAGAAGIIIVDELY